MVAARALKVMVVEDERLYRQLAGQCLSQYETAMAESVAAAYQRFWRFQPDVTFIDIRLPDGCGLQLLQTLRAQVPAATMVMLTGSHRQRDYQQAMAAGARAYITKPFTLRHVGTVLDQAPCLNPTQWPENVQPLPPQLLNITPVALPRPVLKVLIADADKARARAFSTYLQQLGQVLVTCLHDGESVWQHCAMPLPYDVLLLHSHLPRISGYQLAHRLRMVGVHNNVLVIGLLADTVRDNSDLWRQAGMTDVVRLPCRMQQLADTLLRYQRHPANFSGEGEGLWRR